MRCWHLDVPTRVKCSVHVRGSYSAVTLSNPTPELCCVGSLGLASAAPCEYLLWSAYLCGARAATVCALTDVGVIDLDPVGGEVLHTSLRSDAPIRVCPFM